MQLYHFFKKMKLLCYREGKTKLKDPSGLFGDEKNRSKQIFHGTDLNRGQLSPFLHQLINFFSSSKKTKSFHMHVDGIQNGRLFIQSCFHILEMHFLFDFPELLFSVIQACRRHPLYKIFPSKAHLPVTMPIHYKSMISIINWPTRTNFSLNKQVWSIGMTPNSHLYVHKNRQISSVQPVKINTS